MLNPKIVILDDVTLTSDQEVRLRALGSLSMHSELPGSPEVIRERLQDADICILGWSVLDKLLLAQLPRLRMIAIWATGTNYVDLAAAREQGITVTNVPGYAANAVSEMCVGLMLALSRSFLAADRHVRGGAYKWQNFRGTELAGKRLGIVGLGSIGVRLLVLAKCFDMEVLGYTLHPSKKRAQDLGITFANDLGTLLSQADYVSLNCSLTSVTRGMLDDTHLSLLQPSAYLINTARAALVDQESLTSRLEARSFAGAALDDIDLHSPSAHKLFQLDNVLLSPHCGFHTAEALKIKSDVCIMNVGAFIAGDPINVV